MGTIQERGQVGDGGKGPIAGARPLSWPRGVGNPGSGRSVGPKSREDRIPSGSGGGLIEPMMREGISLLIASVFLCGKKQGHQLRAQSWEVRPRCEEGGSVLCV